MEGISSKYVPLDEKDRAILRVLANNPRASVADIAREVGVQRDTVSYRMERIEKRGAITKYHIVFEPEALGFSLFVNVFVKTKPVARETINEFEKALVGHKHVTHVSRMVGNYDYFLQIAAREINELDQVLDDVKLMKEGVIDELEINHVIDGLKIDDFSALL